MTTLVVLVCVSMVALVAFLRLPASAIALFLRRAVPYTLFALGAALMLLGRGGLGLMTIMGGVALLRRSSGVGRFGGRGARHSGSPKTSNVRSAALEMELNHETGDMNGVVLVGRFENQVLDELALEDLQILRDEIRDDGESLALLDAYLDRRFPTWRENAHFDGGTGQRSAPGSGPMGEEEAYEVLGLSPGASVDEIRKSHRRLMKRAHPDSGGSTFLAAKINEAKDVLLKSHS